MNCEFCNLTDKDKRYLLMESEHWVCFLADNQNYIGRCIIASKSHIESIDKLSNEEWLELKRIIERVQSALKSTLNASHFNITCLMNNAFKSEMPSPHMHFHIIPRYKKSVVINNNIYCDRQFGHHYDNKEKCLISENDIEILFKMLYTELKEIL